MTRKRFIKILRGVFLFQGREDYIKGVIDFVQLCDTPYAVEFAEQAMYLRRLYLRSGTPLPRELRFSRDLHRWRDEIRRWNETQACWQEART